MKLDIKNINVGILISKRVKENNIEMSRICNFFKCEEDEVLKMYESENLNTDILLKWSNY